ncbi:hypothetical protein GCM10009804_63790 [Kribbella hippodromi]|uniref:Uncharacterized protein n=1 Tax=Kribbella hippodromi TaxID=434347 RepID=A0ABP4Q1Y7_9ACTN
MLSPPLKGFSTTNAINPTGSATIPSAATRGGPPYLPIGPRTARPCLSTQNAHPAGAAGQFSGGCQRRGGRQPRRGGSGHSGGVLNCLTRTLPAGQPSDPGTNTPGHPPNAA